MSRTTKQSSPHPETAVGAASASENLTFEKALAELEKLVGRMEGGELTLEQSLTFHRRGLELARYCQERLEAARLQVSMLEGEVLKSLAHPADADEADEGEG
ncbi:MAG: exodeoxyribonuclease VII small subunit [Betaproteobacteria bacterium]|jgi:exodeoxyribonuclease VII small subunit|nr:exodeoxyribonuclease VII small subunit [Betaproteobacteria bacterium]